MDVRYGINLSVINQTNSGFPGQRTYLFRAADPAGGAALPSSTGGLTLCVGKFGEVSGPIRSLWNFNMFNSNSPWGNGADPGVTFLEGPTYGYHTIIVTPRIAQFGAVLEF